MRIAIVETPAGFEPNSAQVAGKVADFLALRLQNYQPVIDVIAARKRGTPFSPDDPEILRPLLSADMIFMGAGSPSYAVRQLSGSLAWDLIRARHRLGAALVFASAATVAVGAYSLPVYEIFKVGEEITCPPGLDLFADFGLAISCVPHWNNSDGGENVDTSRCFIGMERFDLWCAMLPKDHVVLGLDEHTGILLDFNQATISVSGISSVTILKNCVSELHPAGNSSNMTSLGIVSCPRYAGDGLPAEIWNMVLQSTVSEEEQVHPEELEKLLRLRKTARSQNNWALSDQLRQQIQALGWQVQDTAEGQTVRKDTDR
jgi:hypothetical protein